MHRLTETVALRSIKYKNMKCGVCKVVNYSECSAGIKHVYGCWTKHRYQTMHPVCLLLSPSGTSRKKTTLLAKVLRGEEIPPHNVVLFPTTLSGIVKFCGRAVGLDSVQLTNKSLFRSRILLLSCIVSYRVGSRIPQLNCKVQFFSLHSITNS